MSMIEIECRIFWALAALNYGPPLYWAEELRRLSTALANAYRGRMYGEAVGRSHTFNLLRTVALLAA